MTLELVQVDAFAERPFTGNPAGVCPLPDGDWPSDSWLQAVAAEVNVAETAFLRPTGPGRWDLRWFTPTVEVDLCGHATLASAHALRTHWGVVDEEMTFATRSGDLRVRTAEGGDLAMDLPLDPPMPTTARADLLDALGLDPGRVDTLSSRGFDVVVLADAAQVDAVEPDMAALACACATAAIVTAPSGGDVDAVSRVFGPAVGIPEDPVTGSAHAVLTPLWAHRLDRPRLRFEQRSRRGGRLTGELVGGDIVRLVGSCVTTLVARLTEAAAPSTT